MRSTGVRAVVAALAAVSTLAVATSPVGAARGGRVAPRYQYGINSWVTYNCQGLTTYLGWAETEIDQYKALGANSIALAFPLYMSSITSDAVAARLTCGDARYQSPPIGLLTRVIEDAHAAGLTVLLRPLIDEDAFLRESPKDWRGILAPTHPAQWFKSYWLAVRPFLAMAQATHVEHVAIASELDSLADLGSWTGLISRSRAVYRGDLAFDYSWQSATVKVWKPYTSLAIDTYPEVTDTSLAQTPAQLLGRWDALLRTNPEYRVPDLAKVTIDEIGIPAQVGAYATPFNGGLPLSTHPFNQSVQLRWFTAACAFMKQHHMRGIYYFGQWMGSRRGSLLTTPSPAHASDIQPAAQASIRRCFS